ncbi:MAG: ribose 5-phosphate isomerase B [Flavobacteriaceae bacterium]|nr:MAG: ribose 5-phosphate isomerase B [Flavobacteriaceae bacterium]
MSTFSIGSDHAGVEYKAIIKAHLEKLGNQVIDLGPFDTQSVDYPDYVHPTVLEVVNKKADLGIIICGSGNGASMTANKHQEIRSALCWEVEIAKLARQHNNANVLSIPARFVSIELALQMVDAFISTEFEGGRHQNRIDKMSCK